MERRREREPQVVKQVRIACLFSATEAERKQAQATLLLEIRRWLMRRKDEARFGKVKQGSTLQKG